MIVSDVDHNAYLDAAFASAEAAPLSTKRALLVALLIDAAVDRGFAPDRGDADLFVWRETVARKFPALGEVMALTWGRPDGPRLALGAVTIPLRDYGSLGIEDFMVSLYNANTVQRVLLTRPDGTTTEVHPLLKRAIAELVEMIQACSRVPFSP